MRHALQFGLFFWFNGTSTCAGYFMLKSSLYKNSIGSIEVIAGGKKCS